MPRADVTIFFSTDSLTAGVNAFLSGSQIAGQSSAPSAFGTGNPADVNIAGAAIVGEAGVPIDTSFVISNIVFTDTTGDQTHDLSQYYSSLIPPGEEVIDIRLNPVSELLPTGVDINVPNEDLTFDDSAGGTASVSGMILDVESESTLESDWLSRISGAGVVWYHDFRTDAEVDAFRWAGGIGNDPNDVGDPNTVRRITTDGITGACLELHRPAGSNDPSVWWRPFSPMDTGSGKPVDDPGANGTITPKTWVATQGGSQIANCDTGFYGNTVYHSASPGQFDGTEFYLQMRVKVDPEITNQPSSPRGKMLYFTRNDKSLTSQEIVTESGEIHSGSQYFSLYRSGSPPLESDTPGNANQPGNEDGFCDWPGTLGPCWSYSGGWDTLLYHIVPGINSGGDTVVQVWAAHPGETSYTKIWDQNDVNLPFGSGNPFGHNALICSIYENGKSFSSDVYHRYCQMIFSHNVIPVPQ